MGQSQAGLRTLRRLAQMWPKRRTRASDDDGGALEHDAVSPFVRLPTSPQSLGAYGQPLNFVLTECERAFLRKQLIGVRRPGTATPSLLARLAEVPVAPEVPDPWSREIVEIADQEDKFALIVSRSAAALAGIGRGVYAALTELVRAKEGFSDIRTQREHLTTLIETYGDDARALDLKALENLVPGLPTHLWTVLRATQDWLRVRELDLGWAPSSLCDRRTSSQRSTSSTAG